jgi:hypothetical protein
MLWAGFRPNGPFCFFEIISAKPPTSDALISTGTLYEINLCAGRKILTRLQHSQETIS